MGLVEIMNNDIRASEKKTEYYTLDNTATSLDVYVD